jgi:hypothetical protein
MKRELNVSHAEIVWVRFIRSKTAKREALRANGGLSSFLVPFTFKISASACLQDVAWIKQYQESTQVRIVF